MYGSQSFSCCVYFSSEEKIRQLEKKVNELIEESCIANSCGDLTLVFILDLFFHLLLFETQIMRSLVKQ